MRPTYETQEDRSIQHRIVRAWVGHRYGDGVTAHAAAHKHFVDYSIARGDEVIAFAEIKRRHISWSQYPTIMLSLSKWQKLAQLSAVRPVYFVIGYNDAIGEAEIRPVSPSALPDVRWGGRTHKTRDAADVEPVVHIQTSAMTFYARR